LRHRVGQSAALRVGQQPLIGQRQSVPDPLETLQKPNQLGVVQVVQTAVLDDLHQMVQPDTQLLQGEVHRGGCLLTGHHRELHHDSIIENVFEHNP
jgi:hypothetical protein